MFFWLWTSLNFVNLLIASIYFAFWRSIFWFWNLFKRKKSVNCANMNKLLLLPAMEVADKIRRGELSSTQLVQAYIAQIHQVNGQINAVVANNFEAALKQASEVDAYLQSLDMTSEEYKNLPIDKPLLGIPFTAKDNILIKGFLVTAGVPARKNIAPCDRDSECIKRLKAAGSILLAVTNVPTLCIWWETNNSIYGRTKNPYDLRRNPGGSSGGEGALIGAGGSLLGLGNDVGGSLRVPATFCGIYGLKPGPGVLPPAGVFPPINGGYLAQMSTAGPMCRYAKDLRLLLRVLAGKEIVDQLLKLDEPVDLQKISVYYMEDIQQLFCENLHMLQRESVRKAVDYFDKELGMSTERVNFFWAHQALYMYIISFEVADYPSLTEAMANYEYNVNCAAEFFKFLVGRSEHTIMTIVNGFCASQLPHPPKWFKRFINAKRDKLREEIVDLLGNNGILLFPSFATPAPFHNHAVWTPFNFSYNALWNALALPVLTCPLGMGPDGLPTSVQIVCSPNCERILIQVAEKLEQAFGGWTPPK